MRSLCSFLKKNNSFFGVGWRAALRSGCNRKREKSRFMTESAWLTVMCSCNYLGPVVLGSRAAEGRGNLPLATALSCLVITRYLKESDGFVDLVGS